MKDRYFPYFQPIINLIDGKILAYEALARTRKNNEVTSAGHIFHSTGHSLSEIIEIDRYIRRTALEQLVVAEQSQLLTLNISPTWVDRLAQDEIAPTLKMLDELAVDPAQVVIEITELAGDLDKLKRLVKEYQANGVKIAIDDFGAGASQLDRILALEPEIIKLDMHLLKAAAAGGSESNIALCLSTLAQRSDSMIICEGVETEDEFHFSIECGADCIQGWLFEPALEGFIDATATVDKTMALKQSYLDRKSQRHMAADKHQRLFSNHVGRICNLVKQYGTEHVLANPIDIRSMHKLGLLRYYLCDVNATQISPNYNVSEGGVVTKEDLIDANWSHRPFFPLLLSMRYSSSQRVLVSDAYKDRSVSQMCRTFASFISDNVILMMDVLIDDIVLFSADDQASEQTPSVVAEKAAKASSL